MADDTAPVPVVPARIAVPGVHGLPDLAPAVSSAPRVIQTHAHSSISAWAQTRAHPSASAYTTVRARPPAHPRAPADTGQSRPPTQTGIPTLIQNVLDKAIPCVERIRP